MSEHQATRQPVDLSLSSASKKPDSQLRLVSADDHVLFPEDAGPTDLAATIISKNKPKGGATGVTSGSVLAGKSLRGQRLAHFELLEPLGVGGMAAVILARDTQLDRNVALKILPPEMASDVENVRRFHQEARAAAKLNHENIARVFFCGEDKNLHFIAFEYVEGDNLRTLLERRGRLPVNEAVRCVLQIATGLEHAASRGVVHRDIKPSNIIISPSGQAKLVDMGLARNTETHSDQALTQSGVTLGTFDYISPEQALEPREADARSDIYSLGCTFYHMLTGQAPVPEGTAAKKLYHHQHLAPIDPRQICPDIPDEIAAILMRMMAKDPKERYQQPIQLVHHLAQVAQKIGAVAEMPEGVMFLDTPLPTGPRLRPMLTVALAALGLGILLMLLSLGPAPKNTSLPPPPPVVPWASGDPKGPAVKDGPAPTPFVAPKVVENITVSTREQLLKAAKDPKRSPKTPILVDQNIDLVGGMNVLTAAKTLLLKSEKSDRPVTIKYSYQPDELDSEDPRAGLVLDGEGAVTFENFRFELSAAQTTANFVATLAVYGGPVTFRRCTFAQSAPPIDRSKMDGPTIADVLIEKSKFDKKPHVSFQECFWERGDQAAVAVSAGSNIIVTNCAFGPHAALFLFRGNSTKSELTMQRCSAFVTQGPVFRLDDSNGCKFSAKNSIFSCPETVPGDDAYLIAPTESEDLVQFDGFRNVYHNLKGLWEEPGNRDARPSMDAFRERLGHLTDSKDDFSVVLGTSPSPWAYPNPLKILAKQPKEAFQVTSKLREVRGLDGRALGVEKCVWGKMNELAPQPSDPPDVPAIKENEIVIDPDAVPGTPRVYKSLEKALPNAESGDVLLVKHGKTSREVAVNVLSLQEAKTVTIKPYPNNQPVLVLTTQQKGAAMFQLFDGTLQFENLEFALEQDLYDDKGQSLVAVKSNGVCSFKNCVVTLKQAGERRLLSVVSLLDLGEVMRLPGSRSHPQVTFQNSLIRGEGDLLDVKSSRPFELKIDNSIVALAGSLLSVQGASKEPAGEMVMPGSLKMSRLTAFLSEPAIVLRAGKAMGVVPTRCDPVRECLFVAVGDKNKPFVALEGMEVGEDMLRQHFDWKGEKNAFVNLQRMVDIARPDDAMSLGNLDANGWKDKMEKDARFFDKDVRFNLPLQRPFSQMDFDRFRPNPSSQLKLTGYGAVLDAKVLPRFSAPRKIEAGP